MKNDPNRMAIWPSWHCVQRRLARLPIGLSSASLALVILAATAPVDAGTLAGRVTGPIGQPVAGAIIAATPALVQRDADGAIIRHVVRSDSAGRFRFNNLPAGVYGSTATFPDLGSTFIGDLSVPEHGEVIAPLFQLSGTATNVLGAVYSTSPLPQKIFVMAMRLSDDNGDVFYGDVRDRSYVLGLSPGRYVLVAKAAGWESLQREVNIPGQSTRIDLVLHRENGAKPHLAQELKAMELRDQDIRSRYSQSPSGESLVEEMAKIDAAHEVRMTQIINEHGWPDAEMVGLKGTQAMWLLVQHASPQLLKKCLPYMKQAAERNELLWATVALSIDRDLLYDGKKQLYGSQLHMSQSGSYETYPVEDEANLDARRRQVGLGPIALYKAQMLEMNKPSPSPK